MNEDMKNHVTARSTWLRLVYMVLFGIAFNIAEVVLYAVAAVQFLFTLFTGRRIDALSRLGQSLASYVYAIILFLTFRDEDMPYPFAAWPKDPPAAHQPARRPRRSKAKAAANSGTDVADGAAPAEGAADEPGEGGPV